jgi:malate synthase
MRPVAAVRPLVGDIEALEGAPKGADQERDEDILMMLRQKLRERKGTAYGTWPPNPGKADQSEEDKYEPQRLNRKICWQYDSTAKKIPLLRRHYI